LIPHKQLLRHKPEEGVIGDCFRTTLACLLDLDSPKGVPHFYADLPIIDGQVTKELTPEAKAREEQWLAERGLALRWIGIDGCTREEALLWGGSILHGLHYLFVGMSKNGCSHVVIAKGDQIVHDPAIDNSGIIGPNDDGFYHVGFLLKLA
jgi:hypothetical protein